MSDGTGGNGFTEAATALAGNRTVDAVAAALEVLRHDEHGTEARVIGVVEDRQDGLCELRTKMGGSRILQKPYGEQLPRIC